MASRAVRAAATLKVCLVADDVRLEEFGVEELDELDELEELGDEERVEVLVSPPWGWP